MQLLNTGAQDQYLVVSPEMSYFKQVYKRHTNFAMQSVRVEFQTKVYLDNSQRDFTCKIDRYGDLLKDVTLCLTLPEIYSDDTFRFRWVKNLSKYLLYEYAVSLDSQEIDRRWGEWMDVWNELALSYDQKLAMNSLTGNVDAVNNPVANTPMVTVKNNRLYYSIYPVSSGSSSQSIASKRIFIPLDFWFTKNASLALPLVALQYSTPTIRVRLRAVEDLYQVWDTGLAMYVSPAKYNTDHPPAAGASPISLSKFTKYGGGGPSTIDLNGYVECNYVFLDTAERTFVATTGADYLVERVTKIEETGISTPYTSTLTLNNPVKELIWIYRRSDAKQYNDWGNFTTAQPENSALSPLLEANMIWNGLSRLDEKPGEYFNLLQPTQHHTSVPRSGIYSYSFALYPEKTQPSGTFNASVINTVQLVSKLNPYAESLGNTTSEYDLTVYALQYNVFRVMAGNGGMVFA